MLDFSRRCVVSRNSIASHFNAASGNSGVIESPGKYRLIRLCEELGIRRHILETYLALHPERAQSRFVVRDFVLLMRNLGWCGPTESESSTSPESEEDSDSSARHCASSVSLEGDDALDSSAMQKHGASSVSLESDDDPDPSARHCTTQSRRYTGGLVKIAMLPDIPRSLILTSLSTQSLRHLSWTCNEVRLLLDTESNCIPKSCLASECRRAVIALYNMYVGNEETLTRQEFESLPLPVELCRVLSFLRDTQVRKGSVKEVLVYMDRPVICTDSKGGILGDVMHTSLLDDWRVLSIELAGFTSPQVTSLKIIVGESQQLWRCVEESLEFTGGSDLEERLIEAWAASAVATIGTFPNLGSLEIDVKLHCAWRDIFWYRLHMALNERFFNITKLCLQSDEGGSTEYMGTMLSVALEFPSVQASAFSGPTAIMEEWQKQKKR